MLTFFEMQLLQDFEITGEAYKSKKMRMLFLSRDDPPEKHFAFKRLVKLGYIKPKHTFSTITNSGWYIRTNKSI